MNVDIKKIQANVANNYHDLQNEDLQKALRKLNKLLAVGGKQPRIETVFQWVLEYPNSEIMGNVAFGHCNPWEPGEILELIMYLSNPERKIKDSKGCQAMDAFLKKFHETSLSRTREAALGLDPEVGISYLADEVNFKQLPYGAQVFLRVCADLINMSSDYVVENGKRYRIAASDPKIREEYLRRRKCELGTYLKYRKELHDLGIIWIKGGTESQERDRSVGIFTARVKRAV